MVDFINELDVFFWLVFSSKMYCSFYQVVRLEMLKGLSDENLYLGLLCFGFLRLEIRRWVLWEDFISV